MASKRRREVVEEGEQEEVESLEEEELRRRKRSWEVPSKRNEVEEERDGAEVRRVRIFLRETSTELVSYSKPMPFDKVLEELSIILDCKSGVILKRGSTSSMAGEVLVPYGEYDFVPSSLTLCDNARCLQMEGSTSSPPKSLNSNVINPDRPLQSAPQPIPPSSLQSVPQSIHPHSIHPQSMHPQPMHPWNFGVYPFVGNMPLLPMLGRGRAPVPHQSPHQSPHQQPLPHQPDPIKHSVEDTVEVEDMTPSPKKKLRPIRKTKQKINLEDLTQDQIEGVKQGGHWKDHWIAHLITLRGELYDVFAAPPKAGVDNWNRLHKKLVSKCPDFNKDSEACRKKWQAVYKEYKHDKASNSITGSVKCKWYLLVDGYFYDRATLVAHSNSSDHETEGVLPTSTVSEVSLEHVEKSLEKCQKEDHLLAGAL